LTDHVATPPYAPPEHTLLTGLQQYLILLRLSLSEYRSLWFYYVFFGLAWPLGFLFFLSALGGTFSPDRAIFTMGGNMATSIAFGPTFILIHKIGYGKESHEFDYWATLPLPKLSFVLSVVSVALLLALPGLAGIYLLGVLMLHLSLSGGLALLVLIPLGALPLAGLGALLGSYAPDGQTGGVIGNILLMVISFLSPMFVPLPLLPEPLRILALLIPTTYVADTFRFVLGGHTQLAPSVDILVIAACSVGFLSLVHRKLDWRVS
jgi:ABC-2 type transport system permease protein